MREPGVEVVALQSARGVIHPGRSVRVFGCGCGAQRQGYARTQQRSRFRSGDCLKFCKAVEAWIDQRKPCQVRIGNVESVEAVLVFCPGGAKCAKERGNSSF